MSDIPEQITVDFQPARVVVAESVYYQQHRAQPSQPHDSRYSYVAAGEEQPYVRHFKVGPSWTQLDPGWLTEASMLILRNCEGDDPPQTMPTLEQLAEFEAKVVELGMMPEVVPDKTRTMHSPPEVKFSPLACAFVRPGRSVRFEPTDLKLYHLRCRSGTVRCTLVLLPK